eukprot:1157619-Pelagomonas_calceolata.AAC.35
MRTAQMPPSFCCWPCGPGECVPRVRASSWHHAAAPSLDGSGECVPRVRTSSLNVSFDAAFRTTRKRVHTQVQDAVPPCNKPKRLAWAWLARIDQRSPGWVGKDISA